MNEFIYLLLILSRYFFDNTILSLIAGASVINKTDLQSSFIDRSFANRSLSEPMDSSPITRLKSNVSDSFVKPSVIDSKKSGSPVIAPGCSSSATSVANRSSSPLTVGPVRTASPPTFDLNASVGNSG